MGTTPSNISKDKIPQSSDDSNGRNIRMEESSNNNNKTDAASSMMMVDNNCLMEKAPLLEESTNKETGAAAIVDNCLEKVPTLLSPTKKRTQDNTPSSSFSSLDTQYEAPQQKKRARAEDAITPNSATASDQIPIKQEAEEEELSSTNPQKEAARPQEDSQNDNNNNDTSQQSNSNNSKNKHFDVQVRSEKLGVHIGLNGGKVTVVEVGNPDLQGQLLPGDTMVAIEGNNVESSSLETVVCHLSMCKRPTNVTFCRQQSFNDIGGESASSKNNVTNTETQQSNMVNHESSSETMTNTETQQLNVGGEPASTETNNTETQQLKESSTSETNNTETQQLKALRQQVQELQEDRKYLKQKLIDSRKQVATLQQEIEKRNNESSPDDNHQNDGTDTRTNELQQLRIQCSQLTKEKADLATKLTAAECNIAMERQMFQTANSELRKLRQEQSTQRATLQQSGARHQIVVDSLLRERTGLQNKVKELEESSQTMMKEVEEQLRLAVTRHQQALRKVEASLESAHPDRLAQTKENERLVAENERLKATISGMETSAQEILNYCKK